MSVEKKNKGSRSMISRRDSLRLGALGAAAAILPGAAAVRPARAATAGNGKKPLNIIFMVSDGLSVGAISVAELFSRIARGPQQGTHWVEMMKDPKVTHGLMETHSLNSVVTGSCAAASAWGTGTRIVNGAINMLPDGTRLTTIADLCRATNRRVALVTTVVMPHATPAGFAANQSSRNDMDAIAVQYLDKVDVLLGGGLNHFAPNVRRDKRDLLSQFRQRGYTYWNQRQQVLGNEKPQRVVGLFDDGNLPYTVDHMNDNTMTQRIPTLAEMTQKALDILEDSPNGFLMQVEGARVDHAAHRNDASALVWDQLAFDDAVGVAMEFARRRGDTLVVVTTDHGNASPTLNGMGSNYDDSGKCLERLAQFKSSVNNMWDLMREAGGNNPSAAIVSDVIKTHTGLSISSAHSQAIASNFTGRNANELNEQLNSLRGVTGQVLSNYIGIAWTGVSHTADLVNLSAFGPGQERFHGFTKNTDCFKHMTELFDIQHVNPSMDPKEAWRLSQLQPMREVDMM